MVDENHNSQNRMEPSASSASHAAPVGFCQECGRGLTVSTLQRVANGVFCPACATQRQSAPGWQAVNTGAVPGRNRSGGAMPQSVEANPGLAALLGFIPGVGAMYNGQYAKGAMHLVVFVILVTLADHLNWVLYWLVWGWVFYQAFDAYHTARARRDHTPLPNPFGWNDVGERLGFSRAPQSAASQTTAAPSATLASNVSWTGYVAPANTYTQASPLPYTEPVAEPRRPFSDNPYAAPYDAAPQAPPPAAPAPPASAPFMVNVPYTQTYVGSMPTDVAGPTPSTVAARRFPLGALGLIGLGVLFLLSNILPGFRLDGRWLVPMLLMGLASWSGYRRWEQFRTASMTLGSHANLAAAMTGPSLLLTVALLLACDAGDLLSMRRSWPVLLVVWGSMLLLQRATARANATMMSQLTDAVAPPIRSTSGTGTFGL